jgi:capsular polysaccharide biosynthesis protein
MPPTKQTLSNPVIPPVIPTAEHSSSHETVGIFSSKRLLEVIHNMAQEHFRRVDESESKSPPDKEAEAEINALFDKRAMDDAALLAFLDQELG